MEYRFVRKKRVQPLSIAFLDEAVPHFDWARQHEHSPDDRGVKISC
jgi:hypothetical protein